MRQTARNITKAALSVKLQHRLQIQRNANDDKPQFSLAVRRGNGYTAQGRGRKSSAVLRAFSSRKDREALLTLHGPPLYYVSVGDAFVNAFASVGAALFFIIAASFGIASVFDEIGENQRFIRKLRRILGVSTIFAVRYA